jgi:hypothetical protein
VTAPHTERRDRTCVPIGDTRRKPELLPLAAYVGVHLGCPGHRVELRAAARARGVELVGFGPNVQTGTVVLSVETPTPENEPTLDTMFGAANITITKGQPAEFT